MVDVLTPRLQLREFCDADFEAFRALEAHPATYAYEANPPLDAATTCAYLEQAQSDRGQGAARTRYRLAVVLRATGQLIGRVTLTLVPHMVREWEIGWAIHPDFWGQGLAVEAARPLLALAFELHYAHRVVAYAHVENTASRRVMEKLAMRQEGQFRETCFWRGGWADEVIYALLESEWEDASGGMQEGDGRSL